MIQLDQKSIVFASTAIEVVLGTFTAIAGRNFRNYDRGLIFWGYLIIIQGLNWSVFYLPGVLPSAFWLFLLPIIQIVTIGGFSWILRRFLGKAPRHAFFLFLVSLLTFTQFWFVFIRPDEALRKIFVGFAGIALFADLILAIDHQNSEGYRTSHRLLGLSYLITLTAMTLRIIHIAMEAAGYPNVWIAANQRDAMYTLINAVFMCAAGYAFQLMYKDRYLELKMRAEHDREQAENEFYMVRDNVPTMIWRLNAAGEITWLNKALVEFTGRNMRTLTAATWLHLVHEEDRQRVRELFESAVGNKLPYHTEYRLRRHDGVYRWVFETGLPLRNQKGEHHGFMGATLDITAKEEAESALRESEAKLRTVFKALPFGVAILDENRTVIDLNRVFADISKTSEKDSREGKFSKHKFVNPDGSTLLPEQFPSNIALNTQSSVAETELGRVDESGNTTWLAVAAEPLPKPYKGVVLAARDITEEKRHRRQIESLSNELMSIAEEERAQIAAELHDSLGQCLVLASLRLKSRLEKLPEIEAEERANLVQPIKEALSIARNISHRLTPAHLENLGLRLAIEDLVEDIKPAGPFEIDMELSDLDDFPGGWNIDFYRIVQEALTNIVKHAAANRIELKSQQFRHGVSLTIRDNGKGRPKNQPEKGIGLLLMQQRAQKFAGDVAFHDLEPGFSVTVFAPFRDDLL